MCQLLGMNGNTPTDICSSFSTAAPVLRCTRFRGYRLDPGPRGAAHASSSCRVTSCLEALSPTSQPSLSL